MQSQKGNFQIILGIIVLILIIAGGVYYYLGRQKNNQLPVYKQVINSIIFGPKLKEVLLGNSPAPLPQ